jgi:hypothetical protein
MTSVVERVYGSGVAVDDVVDLKPGYVVVSGVRPPPDVDGMKTDVADAQRATRNCALHRVESIAYTVGGLPEGAPDMNVGDLVRVRHEHLEQLDTCERGLCAINAIHVLAVLGTGDTVA